MPEQHQHFADFTELDQVADNLPDAYRADLYAHDPDQEEWSKIGYRDSIWLDDEPRAVADVPSDRDRYQIIQYGTILSTIGDRVEEHDTDIRGKATLSPSGHKMTAHVEFPGVKVEPDHSDPLHLGIQIKAGHSGIHDLEYGLTYDIWAKPRASSTRMAGFVEELHFEQDHQEGFQPELAYQAVDAVMDGTDLVETRLSEAHEHSFINEYEAILSLINHRINWYIDVDGPEEAVDIFSELIDEELDNQEQPTIYDTHQAASKAIEHYSDQQDYRRVEGLELAASLLESGGNRLPDVGVLAEDAIENRIQEFADADNPDDIPKYWENELSTLRDLADVRGVT